MGDFQLSHSCHVDKLDTSPRTGCRVHARRVWPEVVVVPRMAWIGRVRNRAVIGAREW